jgi:hypothetical protein
MSGPGRWRWTLWRLLLLSWDGSLWVTIQSRLQQSDYASLASAVCTRWPNTGPCLPVPMHRSFPPCAWDDPIQGRACLSLCIARFHRVHEMTQYRAVPACHYASLASAVCMRWPNTGPCLRVPMRDLSNCAIDSHTRWGLQICTRGGVRQSTRNLNLYLWNAYVMMFNVKGVEMREHSL